MVPRRTLTKIIFSLLLLGVLIFLGNAAGLRGRQLEVLAPLAKFSEDLKRGLDGLFFGISRQEAGELRKENDILKAKAFSGEVLREENERLRRALKFQDEERLALLGAEVISYQTELGREFLIIKAGLEDGAKIGELVVDSEKQMVGKISSVEQNFSRVSIVSNPGESFPAELIRQKVKVLIKGLGGRAFNIDFITVDIEVEAGDFVTFPKGSSPLLLGSVTRVNKDISSTFQEVLGLIYARPEMLREVFIIRD